MLRIMDEVAYLKQTVEEDANRSQGIYDDIKAEKCRVNVWRCLSKVMENAAIHLGKGKSLWR